MHTDCIQKTNLPKINFDNVRTMASRCAKCRLFTCTKFGVRSESENRLIQINYPGTSNSSQFTYDAFSHCVNIVETVAGSVTSTNQFVWCETRMRETRDSSANLLRQYCSAGQVNFSGGSGTNYFYGLNHRGDIVFVTNSSGNTVASIAYSPYGNPITSYGSVTPDFGFASMYVHERSGLNLTMFRAYSPGLGRWLARDPLGEDSGTNLQDYVGNNPISWIDQLGLRPSTPEDPTEGANPSGDEMIIVAPLAEGVVAATGAAAGGVAAARMAKLGPCAGTPQKIGDFSKEVQGAVRQIWQKQKFPKHLPMATRRQLADHYGRVAAKWPNTAQGVLNQQRADYLLGKGPFPVNPFTTGGGTATPLR